MSTTDWASEHFVRLFTRDTEDDLVLSWEARGLWYELLRKFDKNGFIKAKRGTQTIAAVARYPVEVVERALPELLEDGRIARHPDGFFAPNFQDANYTPRAAAARKAYSRERSQIGQVQEGRALVEEASETAKASQANGKADNTESRDVTPSHANKNSRDKMSIRSDQIRSEHTQGALKRDRRKASRISEPISETWTPSEALRAKARELGLDPDVEAREFRSYWLGEGKSKANWNEAFQARLEFRAGQEKRSRNQRSSNEQERDIDDL